jgi:hypothetical protein
MSSGVGVSGRFLRLSGADMRGIVTEEKLTAKAQRKIKFATEMRLMF